MKQNMIQRDLVFLSIINIRYHSAWLRFYIDWLSLNGQLVKSFTLFSPAQYKYADIARRDVTNAMTQFKDLRPSHDSFSK